MSNNKEVVQSNGANVPVDLQARLRRFFELYDPDRLETNDFNVLLKYILNRGLPALETKLQQKYGANLQTMERQEKHYSTNYLTQRTMRMAKKTGANGKPLPPNIPPPAPADADADPDDNENHTEGADEPDELNDLPMVAVPPGLGIPPKNLKPIKSRNGNGDKSHNVIPLPTNPTQQVSAPNSATALSPKDLPPSLPMAVDKRTPVVGKSPDKAQYDDEERQRLHGLVTRFYMKHNKAKLHEGIGQILEFAQANGLERINAKLLAQYGENLDMFEANEKKEKMKSLDHEKLLVKKEQAAVKEMEPERQKLRSDLINFFLRVEPARADLRMDPLLDYAEKNGIAKLNNKLLKKYGQSLETQKSVPMTMAIPPAAAPIADQNAEVAAIAARRSVKPRNNTLDKAVDEFDKDLPFANDGNDLPEYVKQMLARYYSKYDQEMLKEGGVEAVIEWAKRNGIDKLNRKLTDRYGQSLQEFIVLANELRDDLIEFYRHRDKNKLVQGIQPILDWGLRNGRDVLNERLRKKYGMGLDVVEIYEENMMSASQF